MMFYCFISAKPRVTLKKQEMIIWVCFDLSFILFSQIIHEIPTLAKKEEAKVRQKELQRLHTLNKHLVEKIQ